MNVGEVYKIRNLPIHWTLTRPKRTLPMSELEVGDKVIVKSVLAHTGPYKYIIEFYNQRGEIFSADTNAFYYNTELIGVQD